MRASVVALVLTAAAMAVHGHEVRSGAGSFELPGTLSYPAGGAPFPAVVLVHGSGPQDRDVTIGPNKIFRDIADGLNSRGLAVLRYDKRTMVHGGRGLRTIDDETVTDACEAVQFLRKSPEIDAARIWVVGHSMGGYVMPRILARCPDVSGAVLMAAPVRGLLELAKDQLISENPLSDPAPVLAMLRKAAPESYWADLQTFDPVALASKQTTPLLILQGERDANVPVREFAAWKKGLTGRSNVEYRSYPLLNHGFIPGEGTPSLGEIARPGHVSTAVIADIAAWMLPQAAAPKALRIGIIGTDTSHVPAFTRVLNDASAPDFIPGMKVVAAFPGGSPDLESSRTRVQGYSKEIAEKYGVEIVPDIATLLSKVDAVLIESVDGRVHLAQARQVIAAGKPFFVDKPLASTLADAQEIARLAAAAKVPWFSSSSLRFAEFVPGLKAGGEVTGAVAWSPGPYEEHHALDLSWYGIHGVETLYALMGPGCAEVTRASTPDADVVTCRWQDGRIGSVRLGRAKSPYGAVVFRKDGSAASSPPDAKISYVTLVREIARFFQTGKPPVATAETLEIMQFMDAAQRSKASDGKPVRMR